MNKSFIFSMILQVVLVVCLQISFAQVPDNKSTLHEGLFGKGDLKPGSKPEPHKQIKEKIISNAHFPSRVSGWDFNRNDYQNINKNRTQTPDWQWVSVASGRSYDMMSGWSITSDNFGNEYVTGPFSGIAVVGADTLIAKGSSDIFVAKFNPDGQLVWSSQAGGFGYDYASGITVTESGDVYITGYFGDCGTNIENYGLSIDFGSISLPGGGAGFGDMFIAKLNAEGSWLWARKALTDRGSQGYGIKADSSGNVYVTGGFIGDADFGSNRVTATGGEYDPDIFVVKYNSLGSLIWVTSAGGNGSDFSTSVTLDKDQELLIAGCFSDTAHFGSTELISNGDADLFIAKCTSAGSWQWAESAGGARSDCALGIVTDSGSGIYITGFFQGSASWENITRTTNAGEDVFIAKFVQDSTWRWVQIGGATSSDIGTSICSDPAGNIYVTGFFSGSSDFGGSVITAQSTDVFLCKYNSNGILQWVKGIGGQNDDGANAICIKPDGNVCLTGYFSKSINLCNASFYGPLHCFSAAYDSDGNCILSKHLGGNNMDEVQFSDFAKDDKGNLYVTGIFNGLARFGDKYLSNDISPVESHEIFVAKIDSSGNWLWVKKAGLGGYPTITVDKSGYCYIASSNWGLGHFGNIISDFWGGFVAKFNSIGICYWVKKVGWGGTYVNSVEDISADQQGNVFMSGYFSGTGNFGNFIIQSTGIEDLFIAKYDSNGNCLWVWNYGAVNRGCYRYSFIKSDDHGNCFMSGIFVDDYDFNGTLLNSNAGSTFLAKFNKEGILQWVSQGGGINGTSTDPGSLVLDKSNNCYIAGFCNPYKTLVFGQDSLYTERNGYMAKCDSAGNWKWVIGGFNAENIKLFSDTAGYVYLIDQFRYKDQFDSITVYGSGVYYDLVLAKSDPYGNWLWAVTFGGVQDNSGSHATLVDKNGDFYVAGNFIDSARFGTIDIFGGYDNRSMFIGQFNCFAFATLTGDVDICGGDSVQLYVSGGAAYHWTPSNSLSCSDCPNPIAFPEVTSTYGVYITNAGGCTGSDSVTVFVHSPPQNPTITKNGSWLTSSSTSGNQWYLNNTMIPGATSQTYLAVQNGLYKTVVTDTNGCSASSNLLDVNTGAETLPAAAYLSIFPNPSNGRFTLTTSEKNYSLSVSDLLGVMVYRSDNNSPGMSIDLCNQHPGVYIVQLINDNVRITTKLIIE